jgi:chromosome partitioning protein
MKVITIAAAKGGSGKTSMTALLAVKASRESLGVRMVDLNADQANLEQWWVTRGQPMNPRLERGITNITRDVVALRAAGEVEWLFIDTPPLDMDLIENAVAVADAVVIPVRTSIFDIGSIDSLVEICKAHRKPFAFVLSAADTRFKPLNASALAALVTEGTVLGTRISYRLPYINALTVGKVGPEIEKSLWPEADSLWSEAKALVEKGASHG